MICDLTKKIFTICFFYFFDKKKGQYSLKYQPPSQREGNAHLKTLNLNKRVLWKEMATGDGLQQLWLPEDNNSNDENERLLQKTEETQEIETNVTMDGLVLDSQGNLVQHFQQGFKKQTVNKIKNISSYFQKEITQTHKKKTAFWHDIRC